MYQSRHGLALPCGTVVHAHQQDCERSMSIKTDVVIIGAGPAGLFQVFELGLLDIHAHVVDSLKQVGGQCTELYPDKPIYDIPAIPCCNAQELVDRLMNQIKPFKPDFHLGQTVNSLETADNGRFLLETSQGTRFDTAAVIIAGGLGAFQPRRLRVQGADVWEGSHIHYRIADVQSVQDKRIIVLGGGDSALDWTLELLGKASHIALIHRRSEYRAQPASVKKMKALADGLQLEEFHGIVRGIFEREGVFGGLDVADPEGNMHHIEADELGGE